MTNPKAEPSFPVDGKVGMNRGVMEEARAAMPKKRRPLFGQRYYQPSPQHPDNLHGNPDARREIGG